MVDDMVVSSQQKYLNVTSVIVIPTFNESETLPLLIHDLSKHLNETEAI